MKIRDVNWNTFDIWRTPDSELIESECHDIIISKFETLFGQENITVNNFSVVGGKVPWYGSRVCESILVEHTLTGLWATWNTNWMASWVIFNGTIFRRYNDYRHYVTGYWKRKPRDFVCGMMSSMNWSEWCKAIKKRENLDLFYEDTTFDQWNHDRILPAPYPGQNNRRDLIDQVYNLNIESKPFLIFRGCPWPQRLPFIKHLRDIALSRNLKEVILASSSTSSTSSESLNLDQLPNNKLNGKLGIKEYLLEIASSTASLSIPGSHDLSRRDQESLGLGVPVIRPEYVVDTWQLETPGLIKTKKCMKYVCAEPNGSFPSFIWEPIDDDTVRESCEEMIDRGLELIHNKNRLHKTKEAARKWYDQYCDPHVVSEYVFTKFVFAFENHLREFETYRGEFCSSGESTRS